MKGTKMKNQVFIRESSTLGSIEYEITTNYKGSATETVLARCWDYLLAEKIRDAVENYMKENYKINSEEI